MTNKPESVYSIVKNLIEANGFVSNGMVAEFGVKVTFTARNRIREYERIELFPRGKKLDYKKGESWKENRWTVADIKMEPTATELSLGI